MPDQSQIATEMYLRDGAPHATVCKVQLKDGRVGVGIRYSLPDDYQRELCDAAAKQVALLHLEAQEHWVAMRDILNFKVAPSCAIEVRLCTKCRVNPPNHRVGMSQHLCCACYIDEGFPPAYWHEECMQLYPLKQASLGQKAHE